MWHLAAMIPVDESVGRVRLASRSEGVVLRVGLDLIAVRATES
eukprot:SAG11_NODE_6807_length_1244_cov_1.849782_1_plen_43_part_00